MKPHILLFALLIACNAPGDRTPSSSTAPAPAPEPSTTPATSTEAPATARPRPEIAIDSVTAENPVVVTGTARSFENAVSVRVRDESGDVIAEDHVTSRGESGHHNPFDAKVWITREPGSRITVDAFEYSAMDGSVRSLAQKSAPFDVPPIEVTLVFPAGDCTRFVSVKRKLPKSPAMARLIVEALVRGPFREGTATQAFPEGSRVNSVLLRDGVLTVDFNERLQNVGGACAATAIRESVTRTLKLLPTVKQVVITAGGSEKLALQP